MSNQPIPRTEIHQARKEYTCSGEDRLCSRRILRGEPYTQLSYPPFCYPEKGKGNDPQWTVLRACTACRPITEDLYDALGLGAPCGYTAGDLRCELTRHGPETDHQLPIGLF